MAARLGLLLLKRAQDEGSTGTDNSGPFNGMESDDGDDYGDDPNDGYDSWWWSPTGMAVRYTIVIVIFAAVLLFFFGGYWHAQRRMRKELPPLPYHAWMVKRAYRPQPYYQHPQASYEQNGHAMNGYQNPPPAYNPHSAPPPAYQPPEGASKVLADQQSYAQASRAEEPGESSTMAPSAATMRQ